MIESVTGRRESFARLLAIWNGKVAFEELDSLVSPTYRGHLGSRDRDLERLKQDIVDYRERVPGVQFRVEHQFGEGPNLATRLTARAPHAASEDVAAVCGLNISRWQDGLLAEEWAVWETFSFLPIPGN
jgi:SnoaL-like polyketide cyclase